MAAITQQQGKDQDADEDFGAPPIPAGSKNYMTPQKHRRMKDELLHQIDSCIRFLMRRLDIAEVVDPSVHHGSDRIFFGATVRYEMQSGEEHTVTITDIDEIDLLNGKISWISPVARALTKAREGDAVMRQTPGGLEELVVLEVRYPAP